MPIPKTAKIGIILLVTAGLVAALLLLPVNDALLELVGWVRDAGGTGVAVYSVTYVVATLLFLPGSMLTLGAGFAYGPLWGTLLVSPVSVLASTLAFLLGRTALRDRVARRMQARPRFAAIDDAVGESGFKIVLLLRLSPIFPFNLLNYALGLTQVKLRDYVLASFLGMLPGTVLYVYVGSLITSASRLASGARPSAGGWDRVFYWGGLAATLLVTLVVTRVARRALREELGHQAKSPSTRASSDRTWKTQ